MGKKYMSDEERLEGIGEILAEAVSIKIAEEKDSESSLWCGVELLD